jgi:undecaprenyl-diphosphatase
MGHLIAAILGVVEGLTEYLPVSSTGHLILVGHWLGADGEGTKSFEIAIQLGAVLAVVAHYRTLLFDRVRGLVGGARPSIDLAIALVAGGLVMIAVERARAKKNDPGLVGLEHVTPGRAFAIGVGQCFALWPGTSRSMCTIVAGQLTGLSTATAAEFSFLLALPTLGAATVYETYKARAELLAHGGAAELAIGLVVSFFVAWAVIAAFLRYLTRRGLEPFGYYRILLGIVVLWVLMRG